MSQSSSKGKFEARIEDYRLVCGINRREALSGELLGRSDNHVGCIARRGRDGVGTRTAACFGIFGCLYEDVALGQPCDGGCERDDIVLGIGRVDGLDDRGFVGYSSFITTSPATK